MSKDTMTIPRRCLTILPPRLWADLVVGGRAELGFILLPIYYLEFGKFLLLDSQLSLRSCETVGTATAIIKI
jgi:hypothetical protein